MEDPAPPSSDDVLIVEGARHSYGPRLALDDVSLRVGAGRFVLLLGLNGAGKSTLFSTICRLFTAGGGRFLIAGRDMARDPQGALGALGVVFQARTLDLDLSVMQNLVYAAALNGVAPRLSKARAVELLQRVDLADSASRKVRDLSGGQARRVEIARALLHEPRLLLLDEPTVGLDLKARAAILKHVRDLARERGVGVLWATHLFDEAQADDDVVILHKGRVVGRGRAGELIASACKANLRDAFASLVGLGEGEA